MPDAGEPQAVRREAAGQPGCVGGGAGETLGQRGGRRAELQLPAGLGGQYAGEWWIERVGEGFSAQGV